MSNKILHDKVFEEYIPEYFNKVLKQANDIV
jgi:hypothetical protein